MGLVWLIGNLYPYINHFQVASRLCLGFGTLRRILHLHCTALHYANLSIKNEI